MASAEQTPQLVQLLREPPAAPDRRASTPAMKSEVDARRPCSSAAIKLETGAETTCCYGCSLPINDPFLLQAVDKFWHEDCLKCTACQARLGELGKTLYQKNDMILCRRDYLRLYGTTGVCAACSKNIPAFEMVMRARNNVYHLECFACQECKQTFCVGDKFFMCENKILCEYDYEERMAFAQLAYNYNSLAHVKRQIQQDEMDEMHPQTISMLAR